MVTAGYIGLFNSNNSANKVDFNKNEGYIKLS